MEKNALLSARHIPEDAFFACGCPETLALCARSVGARAFSRSTGLVHVHFTGALAVVCEDAFSHCQNLQSVSFEAGLVTLCERAFQDTALLSVSLPAGVRIVGNSCFEDCAFLKRATLPDTLHTLGASAFSGCKRLEQIALPPLCSVRDGCFAECGLSRIVLPDSVSYIGRDAFANCKKLRLVQMRGSDLRLRGTAFSGCDRLCHVIRTHRGGAEHRVFLSPPDAQGITRKLSSYDRRVQSAPAALFRLSFPIALTPEDRARFAAIVRSAPEQARQYLSDNRDVLDASDLNQAHETLEMLLKGDDARYNRTNRTST